MTTLRHSIPTRTLLVTAIILVLVYLQAGCGALIGAGFREAQDHGKNARYEHKDYWAHVSDELAENRHRRHCRYWLEIQCLKKAFANEFRTNMPVLAGNSVFLQSIRQ